MRIGFPIFVNRKESIDDVYAWVSACFVHHQASLGARGLNDLIWSDMDCVMVSFGGLTRVSVPDRMMNPSYNSQFSSTSLAISFHSNHQLCTSPD